MRNRLMLLVYLLITLPLISASQVMASDFEPREKTNYPAIGKEVADALKSERIARVLIKLKEETDDPFIHKMATARNAGKFISKEEIKELHTKFDSDISREGLTNNIKIKHRLGNIPWLTGTITQKVLEKLRTNPNVAMIVEDAPVKAFLAESGPLVNRESAHSLGYTGNGVTVAVLDTGIDTDHSYLQDDLVWEECFLSDGGCPVTGGTRASGPGSAEDGHGHGTHVSGIITSSNSTYKGMAPDASIVAIKVLSNSSTGWSSDWLAGIDWATSNKDSYGIKVINMSLGTTSTFAGDCDSSASYLVSLAAAADAAKSAGITLFASAANDALSSQMSAPACLSSVVSVGAVYDANVSSRSWSACTDSSTSADTIACFSNVSNVLDILAPGALITSSYPGGGTATMGGTSMASPHAAAVAALMLQKNSGLSPDYIESTLKSTGLSIYDSRIGMSFPRIDALAALNGVSSDTTAPIGSISINSGATYTNSTSLTLSLSASDSVGVTGHYISTGSSTPSSSASGWTNITSTTSYSANVLYTLSSGDGSNTVYVWYKDAVGNVSSTYNDSITLDITAPTNGFLSATGGSGQVYLSWSGFSDATSGIANYTLVYSTSGAPSSCGSGTSIYIGTSTSYTHSS